MATISGLVCPSPRPIPEKSAGHVGQAPQLISSYSKRGSGAKLRGLQTGSAADRDPPQCETSDQDDRLEDKRKD